MNCSNSIVLGNATIMSMEQLPVIFYNLFESVETLGQAAETLADNCIAGITADEARCRELAEFNNSENPLALC